MQHLTRLLDVMSALRHPQTGCPWDLKQNFKSLVPYTLEEAYEVAEAIETGHLDDIKKELGDLLFQIVFYAQLAKEQQAFDFEDIAQTITDKMIVRHPHVFADHHYETEADFLKAWEEQKEKEKLQAQQSRNETATQSNLKETPSLMDGISKVLPAMTRAVKIQQKAAHIGFDWQLAKDVLPKLKEEITELEDELAHADKMQAGSTNVDTQPNIDAIEAELGDVLFSCVNLSRKLNIDPERALRRSNHKFMERFKAMESHFENNREQMDASSLEQLEDVWQMIKTFANES